jgi:hypothetical protein
MRPARIVGITVVVAGLAVSLSGCRYYWFKPASTPEMFGKDSEDCLQESRAWAATQKYGVVNEQIRHVYRGCLVARGYERQKTQAGPDKHRGYEFDD